MIFSSYNSIITTFKILSWKMSIVTMSECLFKKIVGNMYHTFRHIIGNMWEYSSKIWKFAPYKFLCDIFRTWAFNFTRIYMILNLIYLKLYDGSATVVPKIFVLFCTAKKNLMSNCYIVFESEILSQFYHSNYLIWAWQYSIDFKFLS